jgi:glycosyltransferase involved in cell wall biosynthesis
MEGKLTQPPFFSVLIPTKNRSHLVGHAVQSVLGQNFDDFEIILVDNDDGDSTQEVIKQFSDPRIRYYRTGGLSMPWNWEYARQKANGLYLTVLEDKQCY